MGESKETHKSHASLKASTVRRSCKELGKGLEHEGKKKVMISKTCYSLFLFRSFLRIPVVLPRLNSCLPSFFFFK